MNDSLDLFKALSPAQIGDAMHRMAGSIGLHPVHRKGTHLLGTAFTVRVTAGDNLYIHHALELIQPGQVLVVDGGGSTSRALVGEIMKRVAQMRGVRGFIIDGAIRDLEAFEGDDFPCYTRGVCPLGPYKNGPGYISVPVAVGGMLVCPGDILVGDRDGFIAVPAWQAMEIAAAATEILAKEQRILESVSSRTYDSSWIEAALEKSRQSGVPVNAGATYE